MFGVHYRDNSGNRKIAKYSVSTNTLLTGDGVILMSRKMAFTTYKHSVEASSGKNNNITVRKKFQINIDS